MKGQLFIQRILRARFAELQGKNPQFSVRAFAKRLGVSAGTLSLILLGKRAISRRLAERIAASLHLDPQERAEMLEHFPKKGVDHVPAPDPVYLQLTADQFHVVSEWYYFAILNLLEVREFRNDPAWIAARLCLPRATVEDALERLKRLEMVKEVPGGNLVRAHSRYRTTDDVVNASLRKSHYQTLDLARDSLESDSLDRRDFTWLTLPLDTRKLPQAKSLIRKFQDDLLSVVGADAQCDEVYRLAVQLFPLTKGSPP